MKVNRGDTKTRPPGQAPLWYLLRDRRIARSLCSCLHAKNHNVLLFILSKTIQTIRHPHPTLPEDTLSFPRVQRFTPSHKQESFVPEDLRAHLPVGWTDGPTAMLLRKYHCLCSCRVSQNAKDTTARRPQPVELTVLLIHVTNPAC